MYRKGELLPETFNHHDYNRAIFKSRIGRKEVEEETVPDTPVTPDEGGQPLSGQTPPEQASTSPDLPKPPLGALSGGSSEADEKPKFVFTPTPGAPKK